jgi:hypothetical protein
MGNVAEPISSESVSAIPRCLHTDLCPNCAYSLAGLPEEGLCPECGTAYDQSQIILYGWGRAMNESVATAKKSRLVWVILCSFGWVMIQGIGLISTPGFSRWFLIFAGIAVASTVVVFLRRSNNQHPGLIQVRLNARGCVQYNSLEGPGPIAELFTAHMWIIPAVVAAVLVFEFLRGGMDAIGFWIWFPLMMALSIGLWFSCRRFRKKISAMPDNAIADRNAAFRVEVPWKKVSYYEIEQTSSGSYRICIEHKRWRFTDFPIDAEIRCTAEQADCLRQWLKERIALARQETGKS